MRSWKNYLPNQCLNLNVVLSYQGQEEGGHAVCEVIRAFLGHHLCEMEVMQHWEESRELLVRDQVSVFI